MHIMYIKMTYKEIKKFLDAHLGESLIEIIGVNKKNRSCQCKVKTASGNKIISISLPDQQSSYLEENFKKTSKISWKLTLPINEQRDKLCDVYICSCGDISFFTNNLKKNIQYQCQKCQNTNYANANDAWDNPTNFIYHNLDKEFLYEYDIEYDKNKTLSIFYVITVPKNITFSQKQVIYEKKILHRLQLTHDAKLEKESSCFVEDEIEMFIEKKLIQYAIEHNCFNLPSSKAEVTLEMLLFLLKNSHLKNYDFFYWKNVEILQKNILDINEALLLIAHFPKEKSVKKALYKNYLFQINEYGVFHWVFINVICSFIKDVNILVQFLELEIDYSKHEYMSYYSIHEFVLFLKEYYSEQQLLRFFSSDSFKNNDILFADAIEEFNDNNYLIKENFQKVTCNVKNIHDEFIRCTKIARYNEIYNQELHYPEKILQKCTIYDDYVIKLPKDGKELFTWAEILHNCMASYFENIKNKNSIIYGFFQNDILKFAVEISNNEIIQASGKYNIGLKKDEMEVVEIWLEDTIQITDSAN